MRQLTIPEIKNFANRKGVKQIAVENFLMTMGDNDLIALANMGFDVYIYGWNNETREAIKAGITLAKKPLKV